MKHTILKFLVVGLIAVLLIGCATRAGYREIVKSWVGSEEVRLIRSWGPPQQAYESSGSKFLVYGASRTITIPGTNAYESTIIGNTIYTKNTGTPTYRLSKNCTTRFEVRNGRIYSWHFRGNDCLARKRK